MTKRFSIAVAALLAVAMTFALIIAATIPAFASNDEKGASDKKSEQAESSEESTSSDTETTDDSSEEADSQTSNNSNGSERSRHNRDDSAGDQSSDTSSTSSTSAGYDPDPEPQDSPTATTGPNECPTYDQKQGPYDHDQCDTSQGLHGSGGNGKCAGCTGKADDKAPGGQFPGDDNNGYECDHNSGVGKGDPAHAKCKPPTTTTEPPEEPCDAQPDVPGIQPCVPEAPCDANPNMPGVQPCVEGGVITNPGVPEVLPRPPIRRAPPPGVLPLTGAGVVPLMILGLMLVVGGSLLVVRRTA